jgi:hypothetical protein
MEIKKTITGFLLLALLAISSLSFAQEVMGDVVYLKNGGIVRGTIIEHILNKSIKIETEGRNVFVFTYDEIAKMIKEDLPAIRLNKGSKASGQIAYTSIIENTFGLGVGDISMAYDIAENNDYSIGFRTINGCSFNEHVSVGLGLGIEKYGSLALIPITLDGRFTFLKGKVRPVVNINGGFALGVTHLKGGAVINPSVGLRVNIAKNVSYIFNVGYKWQVHDENIYSPSPYNQYELKSVRVSFVTFSTGIVF